MKVSKLLLASNSPRRRELLGGLDIPFEVVRLKDVAETCPSHLKAGDIPLHIASLKMAAYDLQLAEGEVLITADTIVWLDGRVMGKPHDESDAEAMLSALAGCTHQVYTAVCLRWQGGARSFVCATDVTFAPLTPEQIHYYVSHYHPLDKAGAYGIQEWIGYVGVQRIEGSYFNVMGLPVQKLYTVLRDIEQSV